MSFLDKYALILKGNIQLITPYLWIKVRESITTENEPLELPPELRKQKT